MRSQVATTVDQIGRVQAPDVLMQTALAHWYRSVLM